MKTDISETPAMNAGFYIQEKLDAHRGQDVLFLVSGGSSLSILKYVEIGEGTNLTISTTDERYAFDAKGNNFLQLQATPFFKEAVAGGAKYIDSTAVEGEGFEHFTERMREAFEEYFKTHPNCYTLVIFGIGEDGHTASIFPAPADEFEALFSTDELYIKNVQNKLPYPYRTTITPAFIEDKTDEAVLFAVGETKCENILSYMHTMKFADHQLPALIPARHPQSILFTDCYAIE